MNNYLKERLENKKEWADHFLLCLKSWEINEKVSDEYYKDKTLLSFILKLYFIPLNILQSFYQIRTLHYYLKTQTEIEVIKKEIESSNK
jgi:hypothetical protein